MRVYVYKNLHKNVWSVMYHGKVICHAEEVFLKDCEFRVRPGGRETVRRTKRKLVHAFVIGELVCVNRAILYNAEVPISVIADIAGQVIGYNPYRNENFVSDRTEIFTAKQVVLKKEVRYEGECSGGGSE